MSDYVPPRYSAKQKTLQHVNCYVGIHDISCNCTEPLKHIIKQIISQEPSLKPWLATITEDAGHQDGERDIDGFGPGELERLFAEPAEEDAEG